MEGSAGYWGRFHGQSERFRRRISGRAKTDRTRSHEVLRRSEQEEGLTKNLIG